MDDLINQYNESIGYERISKVIGYEKPYGILDRSGKVESLLTEIEMREFINQ
jgi:hypothetical protein